MFLKIFTFHIFWSPKIFISRGVYYEESHISYFAIGPFTAFSHRPSNPAVYRIFSPRAAVSFCRLSAWYGISWKSVFLCGYGKEYRYRVNILWVWLTDGMRCSCRRHTHFVTQSLNILWQGLVDCVTKYVCSWVALIDGFKFCRSLFWLMILNSNSFHFLGPRLF